MKKTVRIDDINPNTDQAKLKAMLAILRARWPSCRLLLGVSPLAHVVGQEDLEQVHPKILNAHSDYRLLYAATRMWLPSPTEYADIDPAPEFASHGLVHVDHRLLCKEAQELSIILSCSLSRSDVFIPPFNKWNTDTEDICRRQQVELVKFEDGWRHIGYTDDLELPLLYFHTFDFSLESFAAKLCA